MSDFLAQMAAGSRERLEAARRARSEAALLQTAQSMPPAAQLVTHAARFDLQGVATHREVSTFQQVRRC